MVPTTTYLAEKSDHVTFSIADGDAIGESEESAPIRTLMRRVQEATTMLIMTFASRPHRGRVFKWALLKNQYISTLVEVAV